jgi:hypothetical protein
MEPPTAAVRPRNKNLTFFSKIDLYAKIRKATNIPTLFKDKNFTKPGTNIEL